MKDIIELIKKKKIGKIIVDSALSSYTTYRVGGVAACIVIPKDILKLIELMVIIKDNKINFKIVGKGSNLIFSDNKFNGIILKLDNLDDIEINDNLVRVGAGYSLMKLSRDVSKKGLTGLEFAGGIPGTVGGAIYMNAGAYNSDMGYIVKSVKVLAPDLKIITMTNRELDYHYRSSFFQKHKGYVCLEVLLELKKGKREVIEEIMTDRLLRRKASQPLEFPNAGSVFRNPPDNYAGKLIEDAGLKGFNIGGAYISDKHANFIINKDNATASDVVNLIEHVQKEVYKKFKIKLKLEQELVNWDDNHEKKEN